MNIKGKVSEGLLKEISDTIDRITTIKAISQADAIITEVIDPIGDYFLEEKEKQRKEYKRKIEEIISIAETNRVVAQMVIGSQLEEIEELEATLEEAEARIDRLADDKRDLMERIHELEMENQRLAKHCQEVEADAIFAGLDIAAKKADTKKADEPKKADPTPKAADPKAYESLDSLLKFLFGDEEDK